MPVASGKDSKGSFYRWGSTGKKYYYTPGNKASMGAARKKAAAQGAAAHAVGYTSNKETGMKANTKVQVVTANLTGKVRHDTMEGRDFLVAPMSMITEGVHAGSEGPLLYKNEELSDNPQICNGKPVVVYHPSGGKSANDPDLWTNHKVGVIMNTRMDTVTVNKKKVPALLAEAWLEPDRMQAVDERVAESIEAGKMMEVSTGLFTDNESADEGAEWNGEAYDAIVHNMRPDHLAILPDLKGACSIKDGAGLLRLNQLVVNEMSHSDIRETLASLLRRGDDTNDIWVTEVFDDYVVYDVAGTLYKREYEDKNDEIKLVGIPIAVKREVSYPPVSNQDSFSDKKGYKMKKKRKLVDELIANEASQFDEEHREFLMSQDRENLELMAPVAVENEEEKAVEEAADKGGEDVADKTEEPSEETTEEKPTENEQKPKTVKEYIKEAPAEIQDVLNNALSSHAAEKAKLIKVITANEQNAFSKEQLDAKPISELRSIAKLAANTSEQHEELEDLDYSGQDEVVGNEDEDVEPLVMPVINFEEEKNKKTA